MNVNLIVNGEPRDVSVGGFESLLTVLRDDLKLLGTKNACEEGECGSCSVILNGSLAASCLVMAADCAGSEIVTVEGLSSEGGLHPVQKALVNAGAIQCGFCTPGFVVAATHLFAKKPHPSSNDIKESLSGNICRCTGYGAILRGLEGLAQQADS